MKISKRITIEELAKEPAPAECSAWHRLEETDADMEIMAAADRAISRKLPAHERHIEAVKLAYKMAHAQSNIPGRLSSEAKIAIVHSILAARLDVDLRDDQPVYFENIRREAEAISRCFGVQLIEAMAKLVCEACRVTERLYIASWRDR